MLVSVVDKNKLRSKLYLWGSSYWVRFFAFVAFLKKFFFNPTI